jgi:hypothetical protein
MSHLRRIAVCLTCVFGAGLATAAAATSPLVPPGGKVAGKGYSQWLAASWRYLLDRPPGLAPCQTIGGVLVTFNGVVGRQVTDTCSVRRGQAVYLRGFSADCSTVEPPPFHARTPAQLRACAKRDFLLVKVGVTVDGRAVAHGRYATATNVFALHLPKVNVLGSKQRTGLVAAYGEGFLLAHLAPGTHVVHELASSPLFSADVTYLLKVAG